jgi:flagellar biosynthesis protein FlhB
MSENSTPEERTEYPTERRMSQLRKEGALFISMDTVTMLSIFSGFMVLAFVVNHLAFNMKLVLIREFKLIGTLEPLTYGLVEREALALLGLVAPDIIIITLVVSAVATLAVMLQTGWNVRDRKIRFDWSMLNPIAGIRRIFSIYGVVNTLKSIFKLGLILPIAYFGLKGFAPQMIGLIHLGVPEVLSFTGVAISSLFWKILYVLFGMALFDYFWGYFQWLKNNKMTKQEVKEERKSIEGDEETKRKIQMKGLQRIMQRIQQSVPRADVVVTNPTHYAVALKYERGIMRAPVVVAKGADFLAQRIKEIAREANVPVLERKVLARALYSSTEVGSEIPYDLFKAVAEVLAYVYRLKNPYAYMKQATPQAAQ